MTMTDPGKERVAVTLAADLFTRLIDAGAPLRLTIRATCEPHCDLEGETVEILDHERTVVAAAPFGAYDEKTESNATNEIRAPAPIAAADHQWSVRLQAHEDDEVAYDEVAVPLAFLTKAHTTTILVWDSPRGTVAGEALTVKVGIKCSSGCRQAHRPFTIVDDEGKEVAASETSESIWPRSDALYFTEVALRAPDDLGHHGFTVRTAEADLAPEGAEALIAHSAASAVFDVQSVKKPDYKVRIEAWDGSKQAPLPGARVLINPYSGVTDENGVAEIDVAAGDYRVFVSRTKYTTYGAPVTVSGNLNARIELYLEPPPNRE